MTLYQASMLFSIVGPLLALALAYQHRRRIAYMLTGDSSHLNEDDFAARESYRKAYRAARGESAEPASAPASEKSDITKSLVLIAESMEAEHHVAEALRAAPNRAAPNMADLADRLSASRRSLQEARESLVHFAKSN